MLLLKWRLMLPLTLLSTSDSLLVAPFVRPKIASRQLDRPVPHFHMDLPMTMGDALPLLEPLKHVILSETLSLESSGVAVGLESARVFGEGIFASMVTIAALQGALISHQYANNPLGELVVPPGLTFGIEDESKANNSSAVVDQAAYSLENASPDFLIEAMTEEKMSPSSAAMKKLNKFLPFLLPLLAGQSSLAVLRFGYWIHIGGIIALAKIYDFFRPVPELEKHQANFDLGEVPNVVVIGDSMAVGIGCVNEFDRDKSSGSIRRIEHLELTREQKASGSILIGPVFPQSLAKTFSKRLGRPVKWRSAGVDGGDTTDIRENLLSVIQEEVDKGQPPDAVVVLTGANDLKRIIALFPNSKPAASVRGFRSNLMELVKDIQTISPKTKVVFPALPTYRLDPNSIMATWPLSFFLDGLIGMWDSQKIRAAEQSPDVLYYSLTAKDVVGWYKEERKRGIDHPALLAADGIHPNGPCYQKWGSNVGEKLAETFLSLGQTEQGAIDIKARSMRPCPAFASTRQKKSAMLPRTTCR